MSSIETGRQMHEARRNPQALPPDAGALRRSRIARGRAMYRAARGDRDVRDVLAGIATEATETPPPPAA